MSSELERNMIATLSSAKDVSLKELKLCVFTKTEIKFNVSHRPRLSTVQGHLTNLVCVDSGVFDKLFKCIDVS